MTTPVFTYVLRLGDDALILAQRLSEWASRAPEIEEDIALTNMALDLLGQARALLDYAGSIEGKGRDEDDLAYLRIEREFTNVHLVEQENGDFAHTIARQLFFSTYQLALYEELISSRDELLAGVAAKGVKEAAYHRDHAMQWVMRLGDGTDESHRRMQAAIERLWPYTAELFDADDVEFLIEAEREQWAQHNTATYIDLGTDDAEPEADYARRCADWLVWKFEHIHGDAALLRDLLWGNWDDARFQIVQPGMQLGQSADANVMRAEPLPSK